jgi:hypothetical protein
VFFILAYFSTLSRSSNELHNFCVLPCSFHADLLESCIDLKSVHSTTQQSTKHWKTEKNSTFFLEFSVKKQHAQHGCCRSSEQVRGLPIVNRNGCHQSGASSGTTRTNAFLSIEIFKYSHRKP